MEDNGTVPLWETKKGNKGAVKKNCRPKIMAFFFLVLIITFMFFLSHFKSVIVVDKEETSKFYTFSRTVGAFLAEKRIEIDPYDHLEPGKEKRIQSGDTIIIKRAKPVFLAFNGDLQEKVWTHAATVKDFLKEKNIFLHKFDLVYPALNKPLCSLDEIRVMRMDEEYYLEREAIPFSTVKIHNPRMEPGTVTVLQEGTEGVKENVIELVKQNGTIIYRGVISSRVASVPVNRVLEYGDNFVLSRSGRTFEFVKEFKMSATAYCPGTPGSGCPIDERGASQCTGFYNDGYTFTGIKAVAGDGSRANPHIIAVDPSIIPLKSLLYLEGYGFARAEDTGSAIKEYKIDILFDKHEEARLFGRKEIRVYLLKE